jgi:hypothetical protein
MPVLPVHRAHVALKTRGFSLIKENSMQQCQCNHDPLWIKKEIEGKRPPQKFREVNGTYELFCEVCGGLWDHRATDRVIDLVMSGAFAGREDASHPAKPLDRELKCECVKASAA